MEINIDEVDRLGSFIEIEKMTDEDGQSTQETLVGILESFGVPRSDRIHEGYDTLVDRHNQSQ